MGRPPHSTTRSNAVFLRLPLGPYCVVHLGEASGIIHTVSPLSFDANFALNMGGPQA